MTVLERHVEAAVVSAGDLRWFRGYLQGLLDAGTTKEQLEGVLRHVHEHLGDRGDERAADLVLDGLDFLTGWCAPHASVSRNPGLLKDKVTIKPGFDDLPAGFDAFA
jgi:hypothetical protein